MTFVRAIPLFCLLSNILLACAQTAQHPALLPKPQHIVYNEGRLALQGLHIALPSHPAREDSFAWTDRPRTHPPAIAAASSSATSPRNSTAACPISWTPSPACARITKSPGLPNTSPTVWPPGLAAGMPSMRIGGACRGASRHFLSVTRETAVCRPSKSVLGQWN